MGGQRLCTIPLSKVLRGRRSSVKDLPGKMRPLIYAAAQTHNSRAAQKNRVGSYEEYSSTGKEARGNEEYNSLV